jgi:hypothetical protein
LKPLLAWILKTETGKVIQIFEMRNPERAQAHEINIPTSVLDLPPYENPRAKEYDQLITSIDKPDIDRRLKETPIGFKWYRVYKEALGERQLTELMPLFQEKLKDQVLIDLGGGHKSLMLDFAERSGVAEYINVDRYMPGLKDNTYLDVAETEQEHTRAQAVQSDILYFASRLPDNSVNFTINGIDDMVIGNHKYQSALAQEMMRAALPGGLIFGTGSRSLYYLHHYEGAYERKRLYDRSDLNIFTKVPREESDKS